MPFLQTRPAEARTPEVVVLPDQRKRLIRFFRLTQTGEIPYGLTTLPGTADPWPETAPTGFTGLYLTYKKLSDNSTVNLAGGKDPIPWVELTYEQIALTGETGTGEADITTLTDGRTQAVDEWVQFSSTTFVPETINVTSVTANGQTCYLFLQETEDDGTLRQIKRTYQSAGTVSTDNQSLAGGKLLKRTIESFHTVPATPTGFTLVGTPVQNPNGYPIYTYTFWSADPAAGAGGETDRRYVDAQGGTTAFDPANPSSGVGAVRCIITYLTPNSVTSDPTTGPGSFVRIGVDFESKDGYRVWTVQYGYGSGLILDESTVSTSGGLILYHRIQFGSAPSAPSATIGGTVTVYESGTRKDDGYVIYDYRWAEGNGEISRNFMNSQGGAVSFDPATPTAFIGPVRCVIKYMTATSVTTDPTTGPSSFVRIAIDYDSQNAFKLWTVTWAYGVGLIVDEKTITASTALVIYHRVQLGSAPSAPSATIGGTVTIFEDDTHNEDGYVVYDRRWSEGDGQARIETQGESDGALIYAVSDYNVAATTPSYPGGGTGYLISLEQQPRNGYYESTAIYKKAPATQTRRQTIEWQKPGLASFTGTQLTLSPPATRTLLASIEVSYGTSQDTTVPWEVEAYASFVESYTPTATGVPANTQRGLGGYLSGATSVSGTNANYNGVLCDSYSAVLVSSIPSSRPTGATVLRVDNDPYLTTTAGTVLYRITKVSYTF